MSVAENVFIAFDYILTLETGEEIDRSKENEPMGFVTGYDQIIPGLEKDLLAMKAGDSSKLVVEAEDAYGPVNQELVHDIPRSEFPAEEKIEPGMTFQTQGPHGPIVINVVEVKGDESVVVDLNHPLAGKQLTFDVKVVEVREPSEEEIAQLAAAAAGGCGCASGSGEDVCGTDACGCASGDEAQGSGCGCS